MRNLKVYISKSKQGKIDDLLLLRKDLSEFSLDVVEFSGGEYSNKLLMSSDLLIVLLPNNDNHIGKGQYTEFSDFEKSYNAYHSFSNDTCAVCCFAKNENGKIKYYINDCVNTSVLSNVCKVVNINWALHYAQIKLDNTSCIESNISSFLDNFLEEYDPTEDYINSIYLNNLSNESPVNTLKYSEYQAKVDPMLACISLFPNLKIC